MGASVAVQKHHGKTVQRAAYGIQEPLSVDLGIMCGFRIFPALETQRSEIAEAFDLSY
jgi:hypothetical protein